MRTCFFLISLLYFFTQDGFTQISTNPVLPVASKKVTITFDSSKDSRLGYFTGDLYAHTGVVIEGSSEWKHVIGTWGNNTVQPKLTNKGGGIYELEISPDINSYYSVGATEKVIRLALVFRSSDGSTQSNDLYVDVYEEGLVVNVLTPIDNSILNKNQEITISATASEYGTLSLMIDDDQIKQVEGSEISTNYTFTQEGDHWIIAKITSGTETSYDSVPVYIKGDLITEAKPVAYKKGINYTSDTSVALVLWAPGKEFVYIIGDFNDWTLREDYQMKKDGDFFWLDINGLTKGQQYIFQYYIDGKIKIADPYCEQVSDPWNDSDILDSTYPDLISYPDGETDGIASVLHPGQEAYQWEITDFQVPDKKNLVIYELLIRDFTTEHTYAAVREKIDYLKDLNINVLELMPVNEFEGNSSWGYNPSFYFAPDKYYGPKNELKKLIDECHKQGIAVVIDMVLNHSYGQSPFVRMYADESGYSPSAENPWYNQQSNFQNPDAQWGNDFNHESIYTRELVDSINSFWMSEYNVDGFRFDFTKGFSNTVYGPTSWGSSYDAARISNLERMADEIWKRNSQAIVIFEHLADNSEEKVLANYGIMLWGNMNGKYSEAAMGYNNDNKSELKDVIYSLREWDEPNLVAYMESHDEERLMYKNLQYGNVLGNYDIKQLSTALDRIELNSVFFIPFPGPKMIWQFGELGYDYSIDSNGGRLSEKPVRWDYVEEIDRTDLFQVMSKLNYIKQNYEEFSSDVASYDLNGDIKKYQMGDNNKYIVVVGNFGLVPSNVNLTFPQTGTWYDYFSRSQINVSSTSMTINLQAGEYKLFSTREMELPDINTQTIEIQQSPFEIKVFPNPCVSEITIMSSSEVKSIQILSIDGKVIKSLSTVQKPFKIDTSNLDVGMYILQIFGDKTNIVKFIKRN